MVKYRKILVVIDPNSDTQKALNRAVELARLESEAHLTLILTIYDFSYELTSMLSVEEREAMRDGVVNQRQEWLETLLSDIDLESVNYDIKVQWHNRPFESIILEALENKHDLIIKSTHEHPKLQSVIFTPTDWHLLRKSPIPVLLVKDHDWPVNCNVLAAVSCGEHDETHQQLNEQLVTDGLEVAQLLRGKLHLVNAYPGTPINIAIELPEFDPQTYSDTIRKHHEQAMTALAAKFGVERNHCHVEEGLPEEVIDIYASKLDASLVILGTVGRSGISAALIGNTAEHVIDNLNCDLLAIKPDDFVCPLSV